MNFWRHITRANTTARHEEDSTKKEVTRRLRSQNTGQLQDALNSFGHFETMEHASAKFLFLSHCNYSTKHIKGEQKRTCKNMKYEYCNNFKKIKMTRT